MTENEESLKKVEEKPTDEIVKDEEKSTKIKVYKPSPTDMRHYYDNFLPFNLIYQWLNHSRIPGSGTDFTHREFAFEHWAGQYQRYITFQDADDFKKKVVKANPTRFEIGAVYPIEAKDHKSISKNLMKPISKELVLDIDLTDYDEIRTCCQGTSICPKCWKFITLAIKVIDVAIREDFGMENRIWVFSGRRGVHCWISDSRSRYLKENGRKSFINYLDILENKNNKKGIFGIKKPFHPHIQRSLEILAPEFVTIICNEQKSWDNENSGKELAMSIPDLSLRKKLLNVWINNNISSADKWVDIEKYYNELKINSFDLNDWRKEMVLQMLYPRLDVNVSKQLNHLLKSPFCVHPGTGNVCIPFDPENKIFDPFNDAPTLQDIFKQDELDWKNTKLKDSIILFKEYVNGFLKQEGQLKRELEEDSLDF